MRTRRHAAMLIACRAAVTTACPSAAPGASITRPAESIVVLLIRHGEKACDTNSDPSLSDAGRARATTLADALRDAGVTHVVTTPLRRMQETAAPLL